jgi:hypothetical protein
MPKKIVAHGGAGENSHTCPGYLPPEGVPKFDDIVAEDNFEGFDEYRGVVVAEGFSLIVA